MALRAFRCQEEASWGAGGTCCKEALRSRAGRGHPQRGVEAPGGKGDCAGQRRVLPPRSQPRCLPEAVLSVFSSCHRSCIRPPSSHSILGCGHRVRHMKLLAGLVQLCRRYCHSWGSAVSSASCLPAAPPGLRSLGCCQPRACIDVHSARCHRLSPFGLLTPQSRGGKSRGPGPVATLCVHQSFR